MDAHRPQISALALEPAGPSSPGGEAPRPPVEESRDQEKKPQRDLRMTTADEFLATAAREYEAGTVDRTLWRRAVEQCRSDPSLVIAAYLRARATELQLRHKAEDRSSDQSEAQSKPPAGHADPDAKARTKTGSTFFAGASGGVRKKIVWTAAAVAALASTVAIVYMMVLPAERESSQPRTAAVAAPAARSTAPSAAAGEQSAVKGSSGGAGQDRPKPAYAATVQQLKDAGNWNVLVLYAAEWTRQEPNNAAAWRELATGYARLRQYNEALDSAEKAVQLSPADASAWRNLGQINLAVDRLAEAGSAFDKALAVNPGDVDALCGTALVAQRQSRPMVTDGAVSCPGLGNGEITVAPAGTSSVRRVVSSAGR